MREEGARGGAARGHSLRPSRGRLGSPAPSPGPSRPRTLSSAEGSRSPRGKERSPRGEQRSRAERSAAARRGRRGRACRAQLAPALAGGDSSLRQTAAAPAESRREDAQSHDALVLRLVLLLGHRHRGPGTREPGSGLLGRRLQQGCSGRFLRGGVGAGTVRRGGLGGWGRRAEALGPGGAGHPGRRLGLLPAARFGRLPFAAPAPRDTGAGLPALGFCRLRERARDRSRASRRRRARPGRCSCGRQPGCSPPPPPLRLPPPRVTAPPHVGPACPSGVSDRDYSLPEGPVCLVIFWG